ncbi:ATP-binding cassette domain-containing protein [Rhodococcus sp. WB9]|uniref:ABC transporter ATP-binding protein n=1 Tax=Rhodococcus sp. WB9 TaxID=2594007 RepID=UPI001185C3AE|nr:ATP-binding cassette domain-containing protein [Rhodococcus sp. WB9]QDQ90528.1 ATP-binding cassette domain-containing protein [Rhodococcus sp. WB9]
MMFRRAQTAARQRPARDALELLHVTYSFGDYTAVKDLSLVIEAGECFGLLGPNGAGKTTTIRLLNTLLPLQDGDVSIFGYDARTQAMAVRRLLGYVPQQLSIEGALTARENVSWFARLYDVPRSERRRRVDEVLEMVDLADVADRVASSFSGGIVRRLELAQALVNRPSLLVLDEPTVGLDPVARDSVWARVTEMQKQYGMTVLLTTHYMEEAEALCDRVALMHRGELRAVGSPSGLVAELGPDATLDDVFRHFTGDSLTADEKGGLRDVRSARRTARRLG